MIGSLTRFRIEGLHNIYTFDIPIQDNKLVLVGENGTGKSTVANFIYFFLTHQWKRMLEYQFSNVLAVIDDTEFQISRDEIKEYIMVSQIAGLSPSKTLREIRILFRGQELFREQEFDEDLIVSKFKNLEDDFRKTTNTHILYLPTYRRIEQKLSAILPNLADRDEEPIQSRIDRKIERDYEELVQFGMDDVEQIILQKMNQIKDKVRTELDKLTGVHLRDVIRRAYQTVDPEKIIRLEQSTIDDIFSRTREILFDEDQKVLQKIIGKIQDSENVDDEDKVVAHFLIQLIELYEKQQEYERDVREFVKVCNAYFAEEKRFVYDNQNFEMYLQQQLQENRPRKIKMKMLSSGEKQVVSLFSHIYLSEKKDYFVIIDEPELSISVVWQKRFLPDILKKCSGLIAVTHSPFIFDNELRPYAHSLETFTEIFDGDLESEDEYDELDIGEIPF